MALPNARQNIVGCQVSNSDLGLTVAASANVAASQVSNTITDDCPRSILVLAAIASGTLTINAKIGTGTISAPGTSPTQTITLIGSASAGYVKFDTTSSNLSYAIGLVGTTAQVTQFVVLDLGKLSNGEDSVSVGAGQLSFESSVTGDGTGVFPITV